MPFGLPDRTLTPSLAKFAVAVRGFTVDDEDMVCLDLFVDFVSSADRVRRAKLILSR